MGEQTSLVVTTQRRSYLGINLSVIVQDPYEENTTLLRVRKICIDRKTCYILFLDRKTYDVKKPVLSM